jgi:hypothetical protein
MSDEEQSEDYLGALLYLCICVSQTAARSFPTQSSVLGTYLLPCLSRSTSQRKSSGATVTSQRLAVRGAYQASRRSSLSTVLYTSKHVTNTQVYIRKVRRDGHIYIYIYIYINGPRRANTALCLDSSLSTAIRPGPLPSLRCGCNCYIRCPYLLKGNAGTRCVHQELPNETSAVTS